MDVSIIIVNYNTIKFLINAIDSVFERTRDIEFEIIVVDNNSSDNSKNIVQEKYGDNVTYLALPENVGFGRANNAAAKIAKGRNLFFLNPDTILMNNAIKILSDYLDYHEQVALCGGNLYDEYNNPIHSFRRTLSPIFGELNRLFFRFPEKIIYGKNSIFNHTNNPLGVAYITGADMMIRRNVFDITNGFDKEFFMYYEETELAYRMHKLKYKIMNIPNARIIHLEGKSIFSDLDRVKKELVARRLFLFKTRNKTTRIVADSIFFINALLRFIFFCIIKNDEKMTLWLFILKETFNKRNGF
ncbi:MAG: glycosyltransferase family 2 protein [Bacteroidales bacterium]|jgi:GT2 family glycosyltransferase|nr:glycosyltransferase family 2 protein [Bacteroidales bacterium]